MNVKIVLATGNPHKVEELRAIMGGQPLARSVEIVGLQEIPGGAAIAEPPETGVTFEENAAIKALYYAGRTGLWCLADDSGLEVDALGGAPGVISSHYCTDGRDVGMTRAERDDANNRRLLLELEGVPSERRTARFICVMALARPGDPPAIAALTRGTFEGRIGLPSDVPRGAHGFGYDPLFLVEPEYAKTSAELQPSEKNSLSHRARAAAGMRAHLASTFPHIAPAPRS